MYSILRRDTTAQGAKKNTSPNVIRGNFKVEIYFSGTALGLDKIDYKILKRLQKTAKTALCTHSKKSGKVVIFHHPCHRKKLYNHIPKRGKDHTDSKCY